MPVQTHYSVYLEWIGLKIEEVHPLAKNFLESSDRSDISEISEFIFFDDDIPENPLVLCKSEEQNISNPKGFSKTCRYLISIQGEDWKKVKLARDQSINVFAKIHFSENTKNFALIIIDQISPKNPELQNFFILEPNYTVNITKLLQSRHLRFSKTFSQLNNDPSGALNIDPKEPRSKIGLIAHDILARALVMKESPTKWTRGQKIDMLGKIF